MATGSADDDGDPPQWQETRPPLPVSLLDVDDMPLFVWNPQPMGENMPVSNAQAMGQNMPMSENVQPMGQNMPTSNAQPTGQNLLMSEEIQAMIDDMFITNVQPMGEDMRPDTGDQSTDSEAPPVVGKVPRYSRAREDHAKKELQTAIDEVDVLNPVRNGPLTLAQIGRWADRNITQPARVRQACDEFYYYQMDNKNLIQARDGPGTNLHDKVYAKLAHARRDTKTEQAQPSPGKVVSEADSTDSNPYRSMNDSWNTKRPGTPAFISQWTAYRESPRCYYNIVDGALVLSPSDNGMTYSHQPMPSKVQNPSKYEQHDFQPNWHFFPWRQWSKEQQKDFSKWLDKLDTSCEMDILHEAFFDGTSCPDGGSSMFIMKEKHGICLRHVDDEETRLHWHETAAGYSWNMRIHLEAKTEKVVQETLRELEIRGTLLPSRKAFHPYLMMRPAEFTDVENLVPLFNWYAEHTTFIPNTAPLSKVDINRIIKTCRDRGLPFIIAVPDFSTKVLEKRPDDPKILGIAYVKRFNDEPSTGEVRVLVHHECKKLQIGSALMDMILRTCDLNYTPRKQQPYEFKGRPGLAYVDESYRCKLTRLVCCIAYEHCRRPLYLWVRTWLIEKFKFENVGHLDSARVKLGRRYVFCLSSQGIR